MRTFGTRTSTVYNTGGLGPMAYTVKQILQFKLSGGWRNAPYDAIKTVTGAPSAGTIAANTTPLTGNGHTFLFAITLWNGLEIGAPASGPYFSTVRFVTRVKYTSTDAITYDYGPAISI